MKWPSHGANPQYLFQALNLSPPERAIDFSANINPLGPPRVIRQQWEQLYGTLMQYPDPNAAAFRRKLAVKEGIQPDNILAGNGAAEIIALLGRMLAGKHVLIIQPAFSEYEEACKINGCTIDYYTVTPDSWELDFWVLERKLKQAEAVFFCNPNNPTGIYYPFSITKALLALCEQNNCLLICDEAFFDFLGDYESIVPLLDHSKHLLIIRSMTKMFAIPGLRLGYLLSHADHIEAVKKHQYHWSVNGLALCAGEWLLEEDAHAQQTIKLIAEERKRLFVFFHQWQFVISPSKVNFYLLKDNDCLRLFYFLLERGIIPRHTMNFPGLEGKWLRFAVKDPAENDVLMEAIAAWRTEEC